MRYLACAVLFCLPVLACLPSVAAANTCFNFADTYYQQLYCEIRASGQGAGLPSMLDFRRNNEQMQALILKPYARKAGIAMQMPKATAPVARVSKSPPVTSQPTATAAACVVQAADLVCGNNHYALVSNRPNEALAPGALSASQHMALPLYRGSRQDEAAISAYLEASYYHYLQKMMAIGLGGSTLSYGKFAYLFEDLASKGISFGERFEVMYRYLKADKQKLQVPIRTDLPREFDPRACFPLHELQVCQAGLVNLVFRRAG